MSEGHQEAPMEGGSSMGPNALDELRYLDEQLLQGQGGLADEQAQLVRAHRLAGLQMKQARIAQLGPCPRTPQRAADWVAHKQEVENDVEGSMAQARVGVPGLEAAWQTCKEQERLRKRRDELAVQTSLAGGVSIPLLGLPAGGLESVSWEPLQLQPLAGSVWAAAQPMHQASLLHQLVAEQTFGSLSGDPRLHGAQGPLEVLQQPHSEASLFHVAPISDEPAVAGEQPMPHDDGADYQQIQQEGEDGEPVRMKHCRRCNTDKPITDFYKSKANADGYDGRCKACDALQCAARRKRKDRVETPTVDWKRCRRCCQDKAATDFYKNKTNSDGLYNNCKICFAEEAAQRRERLPPLEERAIAEKECRRCRQVKPATEFYRNKLMTDGLYANCKVCYTQAAAERSAGRQPAESKRCRRCTLTKVAAEFYVSKMTADGLQSYCKTCYAAASAARRGRAHTPSPEAANAEAPPSAFKMPQSAEEQRLQVDEPPHNSGLEAAPLHSLHHPAEPHANEHHERLQMASADLAAQQHESLQMLQPNLAQPHM